MGLHLTFQFGVFWVVGVSLLAIFSGLLFYRLLAGKITSRQWWILLGLRTFAILLLLVLIFKPALGFRSKPVKSSVPVILIDNSRSMGVTTDSGQTRLERVKEILLENRDLLKQSPQAKLFTFSDNLKELDINNLKQIKLEGKLTDMGSALSGISRYIEFDLIQSLILISDGNDLSGMNLSDMVEGFNRPVYCLGAGDAHGQAGAEGIAIDLTDPQVRMVTDAKNSFTSFLKWNASKNIDGKLKVSLNQNPIVSREIKISAGSGKRNVEISIRPEISGKADLKFEIEPIAGEERIEDNIRYWHGIALPEKIRVLMVEGKVRPEYKFLKQMLQNDPAVEFASFVQIRPGKFLSTSQIKGFHADNLPTTEKSFKLFDLFLFGDISRRTFNPSQQEILKKVIESGKGLLVIAGDNIGELNKTLFASMLPVKMQQKAEWVDKEFLPKITLMGKSHPILKGFGEFFDTKSRYSKYATLKGCFRTGEILPISSVLLEYDDIPILSVRPLSEGRCGLLTSSDTWRWALNPMRRLREKLYRVFWGQLIRNLAGKEIVGEQSPVLVLNLSHNASVSGENIDVRCDLFDENAKAITSIPVQAELLNGQKVIKSIPLAIAGDSFRGQVNITKPGVYHLRAKKRDKPAGQHGTQSL